jgi:hypothetical protein
VGQLLVTYVLKRYNRASVIIIVVSVVIGISTLLLGAIGPFIPPRSSFRLCADEETGLGIHDVVVAGFTGFHSLC